MTKYTKTWEILQAMGRLWSVSDCEDLVGVTWYFSDSVKSEWGFLTGGGEVGFGGY